MDRSNPRAVAAADADRSPAGDESIVAGVDSAPERIAGDDAADVNGGAIRARADPPSDPPTPKPRTFFARTDGSGRDSRAPATKRRGGKSRASTRGQRAVAKQRRSRRKARDAAAAVAAEIAAAPPVILGADPVARAAATPTPPSPRDHRRGSVLRVGDLPDADRIRLKLRDTALRLGNTKPLDRLPTVPGVHALALAIRYIEGGRARFVELTQMAMLNGNTHAEAFLIVYADLGTRDRELVSFDDICAAAGVRPADLMSAIVSTAMEYGTDVGNLVAAAVHPQLVHQAGKSAKRIGGPYAELGFKDRLLMLQANGFAPTPKGTNVHVHANASANAQAAAAAAAEPSVPSFSDDLQALETAKRVVQRQVAGAAALPALDAEVRVLEPVDG